MKIYKFVGNGTGVPGIPHEIRKDIGDGWIKEYESAKRKGKNTNGMQGSILKGALDNGNYKDLSTKASKKPLEEKEK